MQQGMAAIQGTINVNYDLALWRRFLTSIAENIPAVKMIEEQIEE